MGQEISLSRKNRIRLLKKRIMEENEQASTCGNSDIDYFKDNVNFPNKICMKSVRSQTVSLVCT